MRFLAALSIICAAFLLMQPLAYLLRTFLDGENSITTSWFAIVLLSFPGAMQLFYTLRSSKNLHLEIYKPSASLDDYMMNDMDLSDQVVQNNFWMKACALLSSIVVCVFFIMIFSNLLQLLPILFSSVEWALKLLVIARLGILFFAIPTLIYNLRTFNVERIRRIARH